MSDSEYLPFLYPEELYVIPGKTLVALNQPWESMTTADVTLLDKILQSVKLTRAAVQIIAQPLLRWADIEQYHPRQVIAFGAQLEGVDESYEVVQRHGLQLIRADALSELDDQKKKALWRALQQLFDLKA